ncbi:hypothetical protein [Flavobacterium sp. LB1P62]|uniref:hypothetical protein n=1 Tax=Flavobacterium sp. LB1P62 TaxID=3401715 RepID=UPI003AAACD8A
MLIWIFTTPYDIPGQRIKNDTALDILKKKRFAKGEITKEEFDEKNKLLDETSLNAIKIKLSSYFIFKTNGH